MKRLRVLFHGLLQDSSKEIIQLEEEEENIEEIIPDFETLKKSFETKSFHAFSLEWLTNKTQESYDIYKKNSNVQNKTKSNEKSKFNKQKMAISVLKLFMKDIPEKPKRLYELGEWKGQMSVAIDDAVKKLVIFVLRHKLKKEAKNVTITKRLLTDNNDFFKERIEEIEQLVNNTVECEIENDQNVLCIEDC